MTDLRWPVRTYLAVLSAAAVGLTAGLCTQHGLPAVDRLPLAALLALTIALAWLFPLPVSFKTHFYLDTALVIAAALLFEPGNAMLIAGAGALVAQAARRCSFDEALFNTAQTALQAAVAAGLLTLAGQQAGVVPASSPGFILAVLLSGVVLFIVSAVLVGTVVALQNGLTPRAVWFESLVRADALVYLGHLAQVGLSIVVATLGATHAWTATLLIPPMAVAYIALNNTLRLRHKLTVALRLKEHHLSEAQRLAHIGSWEWDLTSGAYGWSEETCRVFGYGFASPVPTLKLMLERTHPDDRGRLNNGIHRAIRERAAFDLEHRVVGADGCERVVHHRGEVVDDGGLRVVAMIHDVSDQKSLQTKLKQLAFHDPLTGLLNRARLAAEIDGALAEWRRGGEPFALLFVDLDDFRHVNDRLGHSAGDRILTDIGQRLTQIVRRGDLVARYGGDEFLVLARSVRQPEEAEGMAARLIKTLSGTSIVAGGAAIRVTACVGVVFPDGRTTTSDDLLHHVDAALYRAKRAGTNHFAIYDEASEADLFARASL